MVPAEGGTVSSVTHIDTAHGEDSHRWPFFLPDGRHVLYFTTTGRSAFGANTEDNVVGVYVLDVRTGKQSYLVHADSGAQFANGYLLYLQQQNLIARRFDPSSAKLIGNPQPLVKGVAYNGNFWFGAFSSADSLIAYQTSNPIVSRLTWFDLTGKAGDCVPMNGSPYVMSLSPDGSKVAAAVGEPNGRFDIRVYDLTRGGETRITADGASYNPIWTPDGKMITYLSGTVGDQIVNKPSNGLGEHAVVASISDRMAPTSWSPDDR